MTQWHVLLIAAADPQVRQLVCTALSADRFHIIEAADGDQAWELLEQWNVDVAIIDIELPGCDGLALTRAIRAAPLHAPRRVVLLTELHGPDARAQGRAAGADHSLTKPLSSLQLIATIAACVAATG
jgi:two-component system, chemotaxis family, chemotaxis protein CheY